MRNLQALRENVESFEKSIEYSYKEKKNLINALTHSSYANENKNEKLLSNERLEFLGDSILNVIISEKIFRDYGELAEGELTKVRANIVCEASLVKCANKLEIGKYLLLGKGEEITGGRTRTSILSDAFEAVIGSIYIDGGMEHAKAFVLRQLEAMVCEAVKGHTFTDYKTQLQEIIQKGNEGKIVYEIVEEKGPDHNKHFVAQVKIGDEIRGSGEGKSKKEAEQLAAKRALDGIR